MIIGLEKISLEDEGKPSSSRHQFIVYQTLLDHLYRTLHLVIEVKTSQRFGER